jgi:hypothetical protein
MPLRIEVHISEDDIGSLFFGSGELVPDDAELEILTQKPPEWTITEAEYEPALNRITVVFKCPDPNGGPLPGHPTRQYFFTTHD